MSTDSFPAPPGEPLSGDTETDKTSLAHADDLDRPLDPRWLPLARIGSFIGAGILTLITAAGAAVIAFSHPEIWLIVVGAWAFLMLLLWARAWFWPALAYRHTSYRLSPRGLVIRRGVLWRSIAHVPRSRVQHTDVSQGPLERYFELGTLTVHTAGTQFASVSLDGLAHTTAEQIRDVLIEAGEGDGV